MIGAMIKTLLRLFCIVFLTLATLPAAAQVAPAPPPLLPALNSDVYWYRGAEPLLALPPVAQRPLVAIVIDDAGLDQKRSARAVSRLRAPVTISYLAYAPQAQRQVDAARAAGHEVILHLPWEPENPRIDAGPHHLSVDMAPEQLEYNLLINLDAFNGYDGVNNHMGSRFSQDRAGLAIVMAELKKRNLFFLDSRTTGDSLAEEVAHEHGLPATHRDVFLDHDENSQKVRTSLQEVEDFARRHGSVIAIGHPKDVTLNALEAWIPTLEKKGLELAPLSAVIKLREEEKAARLARLRNNAEESK